MKQVFKLLTVAMTFVTALVMSTVSAFAYGNGEVDWGTGTITAEGLGVPNPKFKYPAQRKAAAREAAKQGAYAELLATIEGINVEAETNVKDFMMESQTINSKVSGVIRGAKIIKEEWDSDGTCRVTVAVSMYGVSSLSDAVMERPAKVEPIPQPVPNVAPSPVVVTTTTTTTTTTNVPAPSTQIPNGYKPAPPTKSNGDVGGYTGVIIDCRGLGLNPVMSPVIKNESGQKIYGHKNLNPDLVIEKGMASYSNGMQYVSRAGSNPLVLKAVRLEDHNANPVLSTADANRMLVENSATGFLEKLNVVFIR